VPFDPWRRCGRLLIRLSKLGEAEADETEDHEAQRNGGRRSKHGDEGAFDTVL